MKDSRNDFALALAREAGRYAKALRQEGLSVSQKAVNDFVTNADKAVEDFIHSRIAACFPDDAILGEEGGLSGGDDGWTWVVDPIDGTVNYMNGFPDYTVSIALMKCGETVFGAVCHPEADETFWAAKGQGAWLDGKRIGASTLPLDRGLALVVPPHRHHELLDGFIGGAKRLYGLVSDMRSIGSAACSLCYVACGRCSLYYEWGLKVWDIAAGVLIAREAGLTVRLEEGPIGTNVLAAAAGDIDRILGAIK